MTNSLGIPLTRGYLRRCVGVLAAGSHDETQRTFATLNPIDDKSITILEGDYSYT